MSYEQINVIGNTSFVNEPRLEEKALPNEVVQGGMLISFAEGVKQIVDASHSASEIQATLPTRPLPLKTDFIAEIKGTITRNILERSWQEPLEEGCPWIEFTRENFILEFHGKEREILEGVVLGAQNAMALKYPNIKFEKIDTPQQFNILEATYKSAVSSNGHGVQSSWENGSPDPMIKIKDIIFDGNTVMLTLDLDDFYQNHTIHSDRFKKRWELAHGFRKTHPNPHIPILKISS